MTTSDDLPIEISVTDVAALRDQNAEFILLDVREQTEFDATRIEGSRLIPMSELGERISELDPHRNDHIVVHCHHGGRSMQVTQALKNAGFTKVQNMAGGIDDWSLQVDSGVARY